MDDDGHHQRRGGTYAGLDRFEARKVMLATGGPGPLGKSKRDYLHAVGHCYRCKNHGGAHPLKQWFVKVGPLAEEALRRCRTAAPRSCPPSGRRPITCG